jgi:thymidylate kinase
LTPEDELLVAAVPRGLRSSNGIPEPELVAVRERAARALTEALAGSMVTGGIRPSPLGPGWSRDLDVYVTEPPDPATLRRRGWIPLDRLFDRLGSPGPGRWAVIEDGAVLACLDLHRLPAPDPLTSVLDRCRRRGEVRVREVLELRALVRSGRSLPSRHPAVEAAARIERGLGGQALRPWATGGPLHPPVRLGRRGIRGHLAGWRTGLRRPGVIALSGVDGAGKSTVARLLGRDLIRLGVEVTHVWTRPGMRLDRLDRVARAVKRVLGQEAAPGIGQVAAGRGQGLASRRGLVGWAWALLVTLSFLSDVRVRHRRAGGVVVYDRHLLDALVTLDFGYEGVDLRLHRWLVRRLMPKAFFTAYLQVPADVAADRKADELFGMHAVREQLDRYEARLAEAEDIRVLDATRSPEELAGEILRAIA